MKQRLEAINKRFRFGGAEACDQGGEGRAETSGVLVRQFDRIDAGNEEPREPWLPCPDDDWCGNLKDRWASTLVNANQRNLYFKDGTGGVILSAKTPIFCMYPGDGDSQDKLCSDDRSSQTFSDRPLELYGKQCIPGCFPEKQQCGGEEASYMGQCSFPAERICEALAEQENGGEGSGRNNEVVVDVQAVAADAPQMIEGFFMGGNHDEKVRGGSRTRGTAGCTAPSARVGPCVELSVGAGAPCSAFAAAADAARARRALRRCETRTRPSCSSTSSTRRRRRRCSRWVWSARRPSSSPTKTGCPRRRRLPRRRQHSASNGAIQSHTYAAQMPAGAFRAQCTTQTRNSYCIAVPQVQSVDVHQG